MPSSENQKTRGPRISKAPTIDVKANDPVPDPRASTTNEDIARADAEGMAPVPPPRATPPLTAIIARLCSLYRSELAAAQTYDVALCHASLLTYGEVLRQTKHAHEARVAALWRRIRELGGEAPPSSGAWGTFLRLAEDVSATVSPEMALAVLEEEEDTLVRDYVGSLELLDPTSRELVDEGLLPAQTRTQRAVRHLHELAAA